MSSKNAETKKSYEKEKVKCTTLQSKAKEMQAGITEKEDKIVSLENSLKEKANEDSLPELVTKKIEEVESKLMESLSKNQQHMEEKMNEFFQKSYATAVGNA